MKETIPGSLVEMSGAEQSLQASGVCQAAPLAGVKGKRELNIDLHWDAATKVLVAKVLETLETERIVYTGPMPGLGVTERRLGTLSTEVYLCDLQ